MNAGAPTPPAEGGGIGAALPRIEDPRLLLGQGRYVADLSIPGELHCAFVRASRAHAVIGGLNLAAGRACPGVVAVLTGGDMAADGVGAMPCLGDPLARRLADGRAVALGARARQGASHRRADRGGGRRVVSAGAGCRRGRRGRLCPPSGGGRCACRRRGRGPAAARGRRRQRLFPLAARRQACRRTAAALGRTRDQP